METCNVCGITEVQTDITLCTTSGRSICPLCCLLSRGERFLTSCAGCDFVEVERFGA